MILRLPLLRNQPKLKESLQLFLGREIRPVQVKRNKRAKRLTLRVEPMGDIYLTVPLRCSDKRMRGFVDEHREWIQQQLDKALPPIPFKADGIIPLRGEKHRIVHEPLLHGIVHKRGDEIIVSGDRAHLPRRLKDYLKKEAKKDFECAVEKHSGKLGVKIKRIQVRDPRTRWGSCSVEGVICFSWRLIFAPPYVLDYLAAHEVAHLRVMDHSKKFWDLTEKLCPETPRARAWLKANGNMLLTIGG